jgi:16S rRNA (cytosine1402-N4)-methyltransferase
MSKVKPEAHLPVMLEQTMDLLQPKPGGVYLDLTLGAGGHARAILERSAPDSRLLGLDRDPDALDLARANLSEYQDRVQFTQRPFSDLPQVLAEAKLPPVDGLLVDLGVSSMQLDRAERGFSFQRRGPLDMRMDPSSGQSLLELLSTLDERELATGLRRLGDVSRPRTVARRILSALAEGRLEDTSALARVVGSIDRRPRKHPATRVFQALRMMVNDELGQLETLLAGLPEPLAPGGRAVFISFHSLEDRAVKRRFVALEGGCNCPPGMPVCTCSERAVLRRVNRRSLKASPQEIAANPRARSARLRAAERLAG